MIRYLNEDCRSGCGNFGGCCPSAIVGPQGPVGPVGPQGAVGPAGPQGIQGEAGPVGPAGPQGIQGETGPVGPAGPQGIQGEAGPVGPAGPQGIQGEAGPVGPAGPQGIQGEAGPVGPAGPQGIQGEAGPVGPAGPQGEPGVTATNAFLSVANGACQTVTAGETADLGTVVAQGGGITYTATDFTVNLPEAGTYLITLSGNTCGTNAGEVTVALALNGVVLPSGTVTVDAAAGDSGFSATTVVTVTAPATVTVVNPTATDESIANVSVNAVRLA